MLHLVVQDGLDGHFRVTWSDFVWMDNLWGIVSTPDVSETHPNTTPISSASSSGEIPTTRASTSADDNTSTVERLHESISYDHYFDHFFSHVGI